MNEQEWLTFNDVWRMCQFTLNKATDRKSRLFAVACCHDIRHLITEVRSKEAVKIVEDFADGLATKEELVIAVNAALAAAYAADDASAARYAALAAANAADAANAALYAAYAAYAATRADYAAATNADYAAYYVTSYDNVRRKQADLLRHIVGNPFQPIHKPFIDVTVRLLAEAVYKGDSEASGPLRDALLDVGLDEFAAHFTVPDHPKGCYLIDLLTGRN